MPLLTMHRDVEPIYSSFPSADPEWRYTDTAGHAHWCDEASDTKYPTLRLVVESAEDVCDHCGDDHGGERYHYACPLCGEQIVPGTVGPSPYPTFATGMVTYCIDGVEVTEAEAQAFMERTRA